MSGRVFWREDGEECNLVERLAGAGASAPIPGFGGSDCRTCPAHLLAVTCQELSTLTGLARVRT